MIAASFRVLKHAPRFGPVVDGTLRGAAIGGLLGIGWTPLKRFRGASGRPGSRLPAPSRHGHTVKPATEK